MTFRLWGIRVARAALALFIVSLLGATVAFTFGVRLNWTASMPKGAYRIVETREPITRGRIVAACAPLQAESFAVRRGYLESELGPCEDGVEAIIKVVAGVPGDVVVERADGVSIDGRLLPQSAPRSRDSAGRPMPELPIHDYQLRPDEFWLYAPQHQSFDSRYFGPVHRDEIIGDAFYIDVGAFFRDVLTLSRFTALVNGGGL